MKVVNSQHLEHFQGHVEKPSLISVVRKTTKTTSTLAPTLSTSQFPLKLKLPKIQKFPSNQ